MIRLSCEQDRVAVLRIQSEVLAAASAFLRRKGFLEILPVLLSPMTDPLHHETYSSVVDYYGVPYQLTKSMIFHKQIALRTLPRIFCFSPNVRMEPAERAAAGRYLAEFVQLDLEVRDATRAEVLGLGERLLVAVLEAVLENCGEDLARLGRDLRVPRIPFERIPYAEAAARHGEPFDDALSRTLSEPAWVIDFPRPIREFYDREDPARPDVLLDMDLVYPQGFGEALSGGQREHEPKRIRDRLRRDGIPEARFAAYLKIADRGLPRSAGFGIGIERLTRFIAGLERIEDARLFAKVPGDTAAL
ncbi:MAG: asparagine synthetase A [Candidatus Bipolaricaulota bacterium]|nr:asparagine synthetase A [Candidatus Bipolaricaulota bacterium]